MVLVLSSDIYISYKRLHEVKMFFIRPSYDGNDNRFYGMKVLDSFFRPSNGKDHNGGFS